MNSSEAGLRRKIELSPATLLAEPANPSTRSNPNIFRHPTSLRACPPFDVVYALQCWPVLVEVNVQRMVLPVFHSMPFMHDIGDNFCRHWHFGGKNALLH